MEPMGTRGLGDLKWHLQRPTMEEKHPPSIADWIDTHRVQAVAIAAGILMLSAGFAYGFVQLMLAIAFSGGSQ